jgi:hypothetical protein
MPDVAELVEKMRSLEAEHRELRAVIDRDRGMAPETRQALVSHLMEEEEELAQQIAQASPEARASSSAADRPRLTVGSLRSDRGEGGTRLGSLRRD